MLCQIVLACFNSKSPDKQRQIEFHFNICEPVRNQCRSAAIRILAWAVDAFVTMATHPSNLEINLDDEGGHPK